MTKTTKIMFGVLIAVNVFLLAYCIFLHHQTLCNRYRVRNAVGIHEYEFHGNPNDKMWQYWMKEKYNIK